MPLLFPETIATTCLAVYHVRVPAVWGFAWLAETVVVLLRSELEAHQRLIFVVDEPLAGDLLRAAARLVRDDARRDATRRRLFSPALIDWWAQWDELDPALREMAVAMPVAWLLALWEATERPVVPTAGGAPTQPMGDRT